jgi:hypothetical protein
MKKEIHFIEKVDAVTIIKWRRTRHFKCFGFISTAVGCIPEN